MAGYYEFKSHTGHLSVYARRSIFDPEVIEIANLETLGGLTGIRALYRDYLHDIPAIAEQIINPGLNQLLEKWGWTYVYRDLALIPTRINPAFMKRFPRFAEAKDARAAMYLDRKDR